MSIFEYLFGAASSASLGDCLQWPPDLVAIHAFSDGLIGAAYFAIPFALYKISSQREDLEHRWVLWLFSAFILLCGLTHLMELTTLWLPIYGADGLVKLATAGVSVATAIAIWPLVPKVVALPSPSQLNAINEQLAQALAENERALSEAQTLFDHSPEAIVMANSNSRIVRANKRAVDIFGYPNEKLIGMVVEELMPERFRANHIQYRKTYANAAVQRRMGRDIREVVGLRSDGTEFPIEVILGPISQGDQPAIVCASIRDVSEDYRIREQLAHAQRIDAIGRMTSGIAHDFNNILSAILANLQLIERQAPFENSAINESLEGALKATRRGAELTRRLLAFTRLQGSQISAVRIRDVTRDLRQLVKLAVPSSTEVFIEDSDSNLSVRCDIAELEAALLNLVANARDAIGLGTSGRIEVKARGVSYPDSEPAKSPAGVVGDFVELSVSDNGIGMDPLTAREATEPFFTTKPIGAGTGLGLSIVSAFVDRANGHLSIASTPGEGTTISILLPRVRSRKNQSDKPPAPLADASDEIRALGILVIDDDIDVLPATTRLLRTIGHNAVSARNREEALAALESDVPIDVILCDISLENHEDGIELASQLIDRYPHLRVILFTGFATQLADREGGLPGPVLLKPLEHAKIAAILREIASAREE